ncbi:Asp23/Gls24 family envelope stress response protein [Kineococcus sp. GCM10028916]|uniref:Asp23/Gls24 family envelope stress response protein n=1 Tax=Kineococcus sp. GCM10028916 TaxID=3273394 RepID=UPI00364217CD
MPQDTASSWAATPEGSTTMADDVVATIAGIAAREVPGVFALGGSADRAAAAVRERTPRNRSDLTTGVHATVGETQAVVDVVVVVEYGSDVVDVAAGVRREVAAAVRRMTDLTVTEVNVTVRDLHLPVGGEDPAERIR